ncbi:uncharacterized protein LOC119392808 [Rhipicephalus sanguineus]|uniref:Uncharacterized protein n=1 Tax=Rhipicephalus sanguineus TaxID=34632 RepID=A0A9D4SWQ0_RHISA|nr:uncharacterized protein LOC119392808 [Rhipicephalus sanguineus]KAH7952285.1 hypothetical protein HPB52_021135 [Rhipicephalus sanguineus]
MDPPREERDAAMSPGEAALAAAGKRCVSTQSQWPLTTADPATCHRCQSEMPVRGEGARTGGARQHQHQQQQQQQQQQQHGDAAGDASDTSTDITSESSDSSKVTSLMGDPRCYGDFLNEEAWLDRMLEQLGLPRPYYNEAPVSVSATTAAAAAAASSNAGAVATVATGGEHHGASSEPEKELAELSAEEYYHKELRDVLWTIVSLKLDDMRVATSQMRAAWKSYVRNSKIVDDMLQNKDRAVRQLKEQLVQLKLENKSLRERICEGPQS